MERNINDTNNTTNTHGIVEHVAEDVHQTVGRVADVASKLKGKLAAGGGQLKGAQERFNAERRTQIRDSPITSVAIAFGVGIALGWLLRSR
jgi:ElaB/YqjD/DUF883 family membrane-anchored ribosome-binding protein